MNFLKNSIFSRGAGDSSPDWEPENENQMLAVWGSPGSGKTTTAVKLAARLAMQKKDVALLLCDMNTPMLPCICPPGDLDEEHSLGSVLAATHVSESLVRHNCITHKKIRHLTILGMRKGENEYTYPPYERPQAEELLQCLRKIAPYIIVDCGSCIANDILSAIALMEADAVLRLVNCDLKSISYLSSQLPLLKDSQWDAEKQYKVASNVYPNEASEHIERVLGNVAFQIPHSEEVKAQVLEGNLLKELVLKDSMLWSSFFVTLVAKKIVLINLCCRPCFIWGSITIITVWTNMIIINVCKFFYLLIECFLCCKLIQICAFILQGIEITLHRCIVVRISCFAHALCHIYRFAEFGKCFGRIL